MANPSSTSSARRWLSADVALRLQYHDETAYGSTVSGRSELEMHRRFAVLHAYRQKFGLQRLVHEARAVLGRVFPEALAGIVDGTGLSENWLYPAPTKVIPAYLRVERDLGEVVVQIPLSRSLTRDLAAYLGDWQRGATPPQSGAAMSLWEALVASDALAKARPRAPSSRRTGVTYVGHASLAVSDGQHQVLIDPFLLPRSARYSNRWQPLSHAALGRPDAILITHSHPDHFDLGTLLRMGADVPIYVPTVARESILAIDMSARLRELGFSAVHCLAPWQQIRVGAIEILALPFYGEQPTTHEVLHPEVRNCGLTYAISVGEQRISVLADAGCDHSGDVKALAGRSRSREGAINTVFGGYRGFAVYPVQYLFSSVSRYLPFVPPSLWGERQQIMCDADALLDVGERWGATRVVPYADGGAPWFWLRGLGPRLDSKSPAAFATDPPPRYVQEVAAKRGHTRSDGPLASPLEVTVLKVGEHLPC